MRMKSYEFYLMKEDWCPPRNHHFRGWNVKEEIGLTAINVVELLLLQARSRRFLEYCLHAYVQVTNNACGRQGSLNTQFGTWIWQVAQLAFHRQDGRFDEELASMESLWEARQADESYVPDATKCTAPYDRGYLCSWGEACTRWHEGWSAL